MFQLVPISRFTDRMVRSALVTAWRLATSPTSTSPVFENATTEGVVRAPSALGMTVGSPPSSTETTELVVPTSMPTALGMGEPPIGSGTAENLSAMISTLGAEWVFRRREFPAYDPRSSPRGEKRHAAASAGTGISDRGRGDGPAAVRDTVGRGGPGRHHGPGRVHGGAGGGG